jgi:hypothetical protein
MLSFVGWLSGITATGVFIISIMLGLFFIYKSRKITSKLLLNLGLVYLFAGLIYLGDFLDFMSILLTGRNIDNSGGIIGLINWMWFPGAILLAMNIGAELIIPEKKWYLLSVYVILSVIFEIFLFLDPAGSITYAYPASPGEDLINDNLVIGSVVFIIAAIFLLSVLVFLGIGFLIMGMKASGDIRRNFFFLSAGAFLYIIGGIFDALFDPGIHLIFARALMISSALFFYKGLKE